MALLSIYHLSVRADDEWLTVGACAASKTDAARLVTERLRADGYASVGINSAGRVAAGTWDAGTVLVYGNDPHEGVTV
jgi:hypothetical protein